ncbi:hypothetical protein HYX08_06730 [Candidatus Woesearchaeota archaeon]|nr:hypothetical protein [Candidatus Woesearchaeota archaeon]
MKKPTGFIEWNSNMLASSLKKIRIEIIWIVILDAIFYLLSGYFFIFWLQRVQAKMNSFNMPSDIMSLGYERAQQLVTEVKSFYYLIFFSFILLLLAIIFLAAVAKGIIWAKTTKTKITAKLISKFLVLSTIWMGFWFALVILSSLLAEPASARFFMAAAAIIGIYFTNILYPIFMKSQAYKSIFKAFRLGISKLHLFILPYILALLLLYVLLKAASFLKFQHSGILAFAAILAYSAAARYYFSELAYDIAK